MTAYYNEYDPQAAAWLRELIKAGLIAPGEVDERSIANVKADDIRGFSQCHFFAGIGGWSYALRLAGWADDRPCWTGSPPCQPFSNAGKQKAQEDARHLWPVFFNLIRECKPANIFGEQVEAAIRTGWLDDLQDDLETEGYATGKIVLPACGVGGYHIRQRIWFVAERLADTNDERSQGHGRPEQQHDAQGWQEQNRRGAESCESDGMANPNQQQWNGGGNAGEAGRRESANIGTSCRVANANGEQNNTADPRGLHAEPCSESRDGRLADTSGDRCQRQGQRWPTEEGREPQSRTDRQLSAGLERSGDNGGVDDPAQRRSQRGSSDSNGRSNSRENRLHNEFTGAGNLSAISATDAPETIWRNPDWLFCRDGKWRPVESGTFPLAHGVSGRVGLLRGYGNAIVPEVAAQVIRAYMEART